MSGRINFKTTGIPRRAQKPKPVTPSQPIAQPLEKEDGEVILMEDGSPMLT